MKSFDVEIKIEDLISLRVTAVDRDAAIETALNTVKRKRPWTQFGWE